MLILIIYCFCRAKLGRNFQVYLVRKLPQSFRLYLLWVSFEYFSPNLCLVQIKTEQAWPSDPLAVTFTKCKTSLFASALATTFPIGGDGETCRVQQLPLPTSLRMDASVTIIKSNVQCSALSTRFRLVRQLGIADDCIALGFGVSVILGSSAESPRYRYSNTCWKGILACTASPLSWTIQHKPHVFRILERLSKSTTRKFDWNQTRSGSCIDKPDEHNWSEKVCCPGGYVCAQHNV